jgi:hypothetical protein
VVAHHAPGILDCLGIIAANQRFKSNEMAAAHPSDRWMELDPDQARTAVERKSFQGLPGSRVGAAQRRSTLAGVRQSKSSPSSDDGRRLMNESIEQFLMTIIEQCLDENDMQPPLVVRAVGDNGSVLVAGFNECAELVVLTKHCEVETFTLPLTITIDGQNNRTARLVIARPLGLWCGSHRRMTQPPSDEDQFDQRPYLHFLHNPLSMGFDRPFGRS